MPQLTVAQVKERLNDNELTDHELASFKEDSRKGVQQLLKRYDKEVQQKQELKRQYEMMMTFEKNLLQHGFTHVAGIDEAGRGPIAGPVVAGAVILPHDYYLEGLNDSKKLSLKTREAYFDRIKSDADWGVGVVTNEEIDQINIYQATKLAMQRAVEDLSGQPEHLLIDAMELDAIPSPQTKLIKGDERSVSIAAASVIAKVTRDRMMAELDEQYPMYEFRNNQGYGTKPHVEALKTHGPSPIHRKTFAPVKDLL
ncbi:ribonuclease HII [Halobacillus sp. Nhm2S1]|uniref:ribonuclease HII n=1 Tax=Halobacillus sp. Nhm2S1 TaxID=2866716 RepID=UPI001C73CD18|nr:ribonuclease HII [Halobacillus sp. Nhm2S1]MBX0356463.1 ribonuclease HII [Halobacillus sp. Nhm2S1]